MKTPLDSLLRIFLFVFVFLVWTWVLYRPFEQTVNLLIIVGCVVLVFPLVWMGRVLLDRHPTPERVERLTTFMHAGLMILFGAAIIRAVLTYDSWRGWMIPIPGEVGLLVAVIAGVVSVLTVMNLAVRGLGAPFAIALSRRLAVDWLYAWTRNPMVLSGLTVLVALGIWFQSAFFVLWACLLVVPALLTFVRLFEERELEIRFGASYTEYKTRTPMLLPRRPQPESAKSGRDQRTKA
jgi:protein-S-isoprenylcysteine O-methyltransferase Ste14